MERSCLHLCRSESSESIRRSSLSWKEIDSALWPKDYEPKLKASFVLCRPEMRRKKIESEIQSITSRRGLKAHEDPGLLDLVTYLNEYPTVIMGDFDEK